MRVTFTDVTLDPDAMQLERRGSVVPVEPQVMEVLCYLVAHRERMVPKTELLDQIWGDRFVSDSALTSRIKSARRAIGDNGRDQRLIRTVHGRGFRFVADISPAPAAAPSPGSDGPGGPEGPGGRVAPAEALVDEALAALRQRRGLAAAIVGQPASARAEAVEAVLLAAAAEGALVGRGGGSGLRAFGGILDGPEAWIDRRPELLEALAARCREELAAVWAGQAPTSRQRLFVAVQELLVAAGRAGGAVLAVEDAHVVDRSALELLGLLARTAPRVGIVLVVSHRAGFEPPGDFHRFDLAAARPRAAAVAGGPATGSPSASEVPEVPELPELQELPEDIAAALARAAVVPGPIDRAVFAVATGLEAPAAARGLQVAVAAGLLEERADGFRFCELEVDVDVELDTEVGVGGTVAGGRVLGPTAALSRGVATSERHEVLRSVAAHLAVDGGDPARIAELFDEVGDVQSAAPHHLAAAAEAAGERLHGEVLRHTAGVDEVDDRAVRLALLELRADALAAGGEPEAIARYREVLRSAAPEEVPWLRIRLGRAHLDAGDVEAAAEALEGVEPGGGPFDGAILLVKGKLAYFQGDLDTADARARAARDLALAPGAAPQMLDVIALQGMIAHSRGEWFDRLRRELRATAHSQELAGTVFDSHVCVAQYLLYGPTGREEVARLAADLRRSAARMGSRRAAGFSTTLEGEARLLSGDLDGAAELLSESVDIHRSLGADTGLAHALQRLAEVRLAEGDRVAAEALCRQALPLARWSPISRHLLQRIAGTLIAAAPDPPSAAAAADDALATLDDPAACLLCQVMLAVPAAIAYAGVGRLEEAQRQLDAAAHSARVWDGPAWPAAVTETRAVLARAEGRHAEADAWFREAAAGFDAAHQPLDAARCREALGA